MSRVNVKKMKEDLLKTEPTLYCSAIAHLRGKLHMSKIHGSTWSDLRCGYKVDFGELARADETGNQFYWARENQEKLVKNTLEKYIIEEEEKAA